jgi:hypothetical protein
MRQAKKFNEVNNLQVKRVIMKSFA